MKRLNHLRRKTLPAILIAVAFAAIIFAGLQVAKNGLLSSNCGTNRSCFYLAYNAGCISKTINVTNYTTEGDPILTTAKLSRSGRDCFVELEVDARHDKFGAREIYTLTCRKLTKKDTKLEATECIDGNDALIKI